MGWAKKGFEYKTRELGGDAEDSGENRKLSNRVNGDAEVWF